MLGEIIFKVNIVNFSFELYVMKGKGFRKGSMRGLEIRG